MAERRTRYRRRTKPTPQIDHNQTGPPDHPLLATILVAISTSREAKQSRGTPLNSILKFVRRKYDVYDNVSVDASQQRVVAALGHGVKKGFFKKGRTGWFSAIEDSDDDDDNGHDHKPAKRKRSDEEKDKTDLQQKWARTRINKQGKIIKSTRTKDVDRRGILRQQRRVNYSVYMSSSESEVDSDSSLTRMVANVDKSSYVKNKEYQNKERKLRKVYYPDYFAVYGSDSDSDPEYYCPPAPYDFAGVAVKGQSMTVGGNTCTTKSGEL